MAIVGCILILVLNSSGLSNEIQSTWQGGAGEEIPVTSWDDSFLSSENINWFSTEGSLTLDYTENIPESLIDADAGAPYSVVAVNMDSDTDTDLLVASWSDDLVAWYRNNGNGDSWTLIEISSEFDGASCARAFDVNNDGYMDVVATAFYDDSLYWFESDSSEYLWIPHPIAEINGPGEVIPMRNNGQVQLLVTESYTGNLFIFKASVQPDTVYWSPYQIAGNYPGVSSIDVLDVDLDGDLDIVVAENNNSQITYLECITWYTEFEAHVIDSDIPHPMSIRLGNIDTDDVPDIAVCSFDNSAVYWYRNLLTGWEKHTVTDSLWGASGVTICDITQNEDGWHNIVAAGCYDGEVRWFEHTSVDEWNEYIMGELPGATAPCATELDAVPGLEIVGAAGVGDAIKFWSPGFYADEGELTSSILDGQVRRLWAGISWSAEIPVDSTLSIQVRGSDNWEDMGSWSEELYEPTELYEILTDTTRYFQYKVLMSSADSTETPVLNQITLSWDDVGIEETTEPAFPGHSLHLISPNPAMNSIEFSVISTDIASVKLLDLTGRVIEEFTIPDSGTYSFQTGELAPGLYFLQTDMKDIPAYRIVVIN